jgi:hypothetical protein
VHVRPANKQKIRSRTVRHLFARGQHNHFRSDDDLFQQSGSVSSVLIPSCWAENRESDPARQLTFRTLPKCGRLVNTSLTSSRYTPCFWLSFWTMSSGQMKPVIFNRSSSVRGLSGSFAVAHEMLKCSQKWEWSRFRSRGTSKLTKLLSFRETPSLARENHSPPRNCHGI